MSNHQFQNSSSKKKYFVFVCVHFYYSFFFVAAVEWGCPKLILPMMKKTMKEKKTEQLNIMTKWWWHSVIHAAIHSFHFTDSHKNEKKNREKWSEEQKKRVIFPIQWMNFGRSFESFMWIWQSSSLLLLMLMILACFVFDSNFHFAFSMFLFLLLIVNL